MGAAWIAPRHNGPRAARYFLPSGSFFSVTADSPGRVETGALFLAQTKSPVAHQATQRSDSYLPAETIGKLLRSLPIEWTANVAAIADTVVRFETDAKLLYGVVAALELAATITADDAAHVELVGLRRADAEIAIEAPGLVVGDTHAFLVELLRTARTDRDAPPVEWTGLGRADAGIATEAPASVVGHTRAFLVEVLRKVRTDRDAPPVEWTGLGRADAGIATEAPASVVGHTRAFLVELLLTARTDRDAPPVEWAGLRRADAGIATEAPASVVGHTRAFLVELLLTARTDRDTALEIIARIAADLVLPRESLGPAITVVDAFLSLEMSGQLNAGMALADEALLAAEAGSPENIETWITPLLQIALDRLLKSPGKIRLLTKRNQ